MVDRSLSEADTKLLETLDPDLARLLYPDQSVEPFTITAVYPAPAGEVAQAIRDIEAEAQAHEVTEPGVEGKDPLHRTTFSLQQIEEFHELYHLAEGAAGADKLKVLLNGREVPLARELWLPLVWTLRK
jgi:hypothetical protein